MLGSDTLEIVVSRACLSVYSFIRAFFVGHHQLIICLFPTISKDLGSGTLEIVVSRACLSVYSFILAFFVGRSIVKLFPKNSKDPRTMLGSGTLGI